MTVDLFGPQCYNRPRTNDHKEASPAIDRPMNYVKSKQRVADHGEVFTPAWMVEAMLDLVKDFHLRTSSCNSMTSML